MTTSSHLLLLQVILVGTLGGLIYGVGVGFVPVYLTYNDENTNCTKIAGESACSSLKHAECVWAEVNTTTAEKRCVFSDQLQGIDCRVFSEAVCKQHDMCVYDYSGKQCDHLIGWDATKTGIFAGALILGCMFGSFVAGPLMRKVGRKKALLILGLFGVVGHGVTALGRASGSYWVLIIGCWCWRWNVNSCLSLLRGRNGRSKIQRTSGLFVPIGDYLWNFAYGCSGLRTGAETIFL